MGLWSPYQPGGARWGGAVACHSRCGLATAAAGEGLVLRRSGGAMNEAQRNDATNSAGKPPRRLIHRSVATAAGQMVIVGATGLGSTHSSFELVGSSWPAASP